MGIQLADDVHELLVVGILVRNRAQAIERVVRCSESFEYVTLLTFNGVLDVVRSANSCSFEHAFGECVVIKHLERLCHERKDGLAAHASLLHGRLHQAVRVAVRLLLSHRAATTTTRRLADEVLSHVCLASVAKWAGLEVKKNRARTRKGGNYLRVTFRNYNMNKCVDVTIFFLRGVILYGRGRHLLGVVPSEICFGIHAQCNAQRRVVSLHETVERALHELAR